MMTAFDIGIIIAIVTLTYVGYTLLRFEPTE
jgi:hypothetical protein